MFPHLAAPILRVSTPFVRLLDLSSINPLLNFSRASAAAFNHSADLTLVEVGNNVPRFDPALGLLIEGQRSNIYINPRGEGGADGTPGTAPTDWAIPSFAGTGLSVQRIGRFVVNGNPMLRFRIWGTTSASSSVNFVYAAVPVAVAGVTYTQSLMWRVIAGDYTGFIFSSPRFRNRFLDSGSAQLLDTSSPILNTPTLTRFRHTAVAPANSASHTPWIAMNWAAGVNIDLTFEMGVPHLEAFSTFSSPILPVTTGIATRLADNLSVPLSALGIGDNGACTIWGSFRVPSLNNFTSQHVIQLDAGNNDNRFMLRIDPTGFLRPYRAIAANNLTGNSHGTPAINTLVPFAVSINGTGRIATAQANGAISSVNDGPTNGLVNLRIGSHATGGDALFGYMPRLNYLPYAVSDSQLIALSTGT